MLETSLDVKMVECYNVQHQVQLRYLCLDDLMEVKQLCSEWFPIEYPESWYNDILTDPRFYSLAATFNLKIIGMIVCEVKPRSRCNREDVDLLASHYPPNTLVAYILSLGVVKQFRRRGIASLLLDNLLSYLTSTDMDACKAVYLHVLTTNSVAIQFYEQRSFHIHACLPFYYSIKGKLHDGFSYVLYINGGRAPSTFTDCCKYLSNILSKVQPCALPLHLFQMARGLWRYIVNEVFLLH